MQDIVLSFVDFSFSFPHLYCVCVFIFYFSSLPYRTGQDGDDYHEFLFNQLLDGFGIQKRWDSCTRQDTQTFLCRSLLGGGGVGGCGTRRSFLFACFLPVGRFSTPGSSSFSCLYLPLSTSHYLHAPKFYHSSTAMFARMGDIRDRETWLATESRVS